MEESTGREYIEYMPMLYKKVTKVRIETTKLNLYIRILKSVKLSIWNII